MPKVVCEHMMSRAWTGRRAAIFETLRRVGGRWLAWSVVLICGTGCGDSGSTGPSASPGLASLPEATLVEILDPSGQFSDHHAAIRQLIDHALNDVRTVLPELDPVRVTVAADAARSIPGYGMGGFAHGGERIEIVVHPGFPGLGQRLSARLPGIVAHEAHHIVRARGPGYGSTLFESMISEGLADHFSVELLGVPVPPWSMAFSAEDVPVYEARARPLFDSTSFDFEAWFFGVGSDLPAWVGYTLGYRYVAAYQSANPEESAARLVRTPADAFRPD